MPGFHRRRSPRSGPGRDVGGRVRSATAPRTASGYGRVVPFVDVRDLSVYHEVHGTGDRVLFISGTGGDLRANPRRGRGVLERRFEVLMYDQRGLGQTSKPDRAASMADYADDAAALLTALAWPTAHVIGVSFGGMVAQHLALRHPDRVDGLVLACTSAGGAGGSSFDLLSVADLPRDERAQVVLPLMDTRNDPTTDPPTYAPLFETIAPLMGAPPLNADDPSSAIGARRQLEARAGHDTWDRLPEISRPTFVVGGRYDGQAPPENLERLAARIPDARLRFFDGGHLFLLQDRDAYPAIADFLDAVGQTSGRPGGR